MATVLPSYCIPTITKLFGGKSTCIAAARCVTSGAFYQPFALKTSKTADCYSHYTIMSYYFTTNATADDEPSSQEATSPNNGVRLSKLIALGTGTSRRTAETLIRNGKVTMDGQVISSPMYLVHLPPLDDDDDDDKKQPNNNKSTMMPSSYNFKVSGYDFSSTHQQQQDIQKHLSSLNNSTTTITTSTDTKQQQQATAAAIIRTRVWLVHKLKGELVTENDPFGRPSMMERLRRGGVGKNTTSAKGSKVPLMPIGRLDMNTEGLIVITNDGSYAREMELPTNKVHRVYRARVHGFVTESKLRAIRSGVEVDGMWYKGMQVSIQQRAKNKRQQEQDSTNSWLHVTCQEGKNRQIRKIFEHLRLTVTRLIRISFGDYQLNTIPPGLAVEVPFKPLLSQRNKGCAAKKTQHREQARSTTNSSSTTTTSNNKAATPRLNLVERRRIFRTSRE